MPTKKRILMVNEGSHLPTGYGTYGKEILSRLHSLDKYEIAEFASFTKVEDVRDNKHKTPWKVYANAVGKEDPRHQLFHQAKDGVFGSWRLDRVLLDFKPDIVCTPPGELVYTSNGYKAIEDIKLKDLVLTHKNRFMEVTKLYKRQHNGDLRYIYFNGSSEPLKLTNEHPVLIYKKSISQIYEGLEPEFIAAKDIKEGDLVVLTSPELCDVNESIDLRNFLVQFNEKDGLLYPSPNKNTDDSIKKYINNDKDFGTILGYIIADSHISNRGIVITFDINEEDFCVDSVKLLKKVFGLNSKYEKNKSKECYDVYCNSVLLASFLKKFIKKIPHICQNSNFAKGLIKGWFRGNGCYISLTTINREMAHNCRAILLSLGIKANIVKTTKAYDINVYDEDAEKLKTIVEKEDFDLETQNNPKHLHFVNGYYLASVERNKKTEYNGQVYNIEVNEDNSYILQQACVHNCDIRDYWMLAYENDSPLREYFHWCIMPTVDSAPQHDSWLETFIEADGVFTYSDWGQEILQKEGGNKIKLHGTASPGVDLNVFKPLNKNVIRNKLGIKEDINIVGTVMRNQKRKLYPDLFETFVKFLENSSLETAKKTFLYVHTCYPDNGWNIPFLLKHYGLCHKVLFTYICQNCGHYYSSFFSDARSVCKKCKSVSAVMSNSSNGLERHQLAEIYNTFDVYIQYAICEGFGMPQVESISCGVPLFTVGYSAMTEVGEKSDGVVIPYSVKFLELETSAFRVYPNNDFTAQELVKFFQLPNPIKIKKGYKAREAAETHYNWDNIAKKWENYFDNVELTGLQGKWDTPTQIHYPPENLPEDYVYMNPDVYSEWLVVNVLGQKKKQYSYLSMEIAGALRYGLRKILDKDEPAGFFYKKATKEDFFEAMKNKAMIKVKAEQARQGHIPLKNEDYIEAAYL